MTDDPGRGLHGHPVGVAGAMGPPCSTKMRAVLHCRRSLFEWVPRGSRWDERAAAPVALLPAIRFPQPDGT